MNKSIKKSNLIMLSINLIFSFFLTFIFLTHPTDDARQYDDLFTYISFGDDISNAIKINGGGQVPLTFMHFENSSIPMDPFYNVLIALFNSIGFNSGMIYFHFLSFILFSFWSFANILKSDKKYLFFITLVFNPWILQGLIVSARQILATAMVLLFITAIHKNQKILLAFFSVLTHWSSAIYYGLNLRIKIIIFFIIMGFVLYFSNVINFEPIEIVLNHKLYSQTEQNTAYSNTKFLFHIGLLILTLFFYTKDLVLDKRYIYIILFIIVIASRFYGFNPERIVDIFLPLMLLHIFNKLSFRIDLLITGMFLLLSCYSIPIIFSLY